MSLAILHSYLLTAAPYVALGALAVALIAALYALALHRRFKRLAMGRNGSIEETVTILARDTKELQQFRGELEKYLKLAEGRLRGAVAGLGVVRFNPFAGDGSGGNQSFAAAFLDEGGRGVVLSSLYARDRASVYAKPVEAWASTHKLSNEEKEAIDKARQQVAARKKL
jgi:hypothetical protein